MSHGPKRRLTVLLLGSAVLLVIVLFTGLQAFRIPFLAPSTTAETLAFWVLTVLVFLLLMMLLVLLLRNILKLYADQRSSALGSRLRTRMVLGAALIALLPAVFMFLFCFGLLNRSIDRWFSQPTSELRDDSTRVVDALAQYAAANARIEAEEMASLGDMDTGSSIATALQAHRVALVGGFAAIYRPDASLVGGFQLPPEQTSASMLPWLADPHANVSSLKEPFSAALLDIAERKDQPLLLSEGHEYAVGVRPTPHGRLIVVALPIPPGLTTTALRIRAGASDYWALFRARNRIRTTYVMMLLLITAFVFFSSIWMALFLSKQITRPVEALADAMGEIASGQHDRRVLVTSTGEMADLVRSFNQMAEDLESSRLLAESSSAQLTKANLALEERRRELETILETIPGGVVTLNADGVVLQANRAFALQFDLDEGADKVYGARLEALIPADSVDDVARLIRRSQRMGTASTEIETMVRGRSIHLSITSARLALTGEHRGSVLVVEDSSELLRAQRQLAWKEVAQRVAHEIKNPLTPIALSAERIRKHLDHPQDESPAVIRKCSEVILGCVATLRTLVDQFSALAQFPAPQPQACDVNQIVEEALALFTGRLEGITLRVKLAKHLPSLLVDHASIRRALANLIDNAAEAMQGSLLRMLSVRTSLCDDGAAVEIAVTDTGHGLTDEIRERLFLPFYSTKQRGTGLGLSIAAKIAQEHNGSIRAEANSPKGACFLLRLPIAEVGSAQPPHETTQPQHATTETVESASASTLNDRGTNA